MLRIASSPAGVSPVVEAEATASQNWPPPLCEACMAALLGEGEWKQAQHYFERLERAEREGNAAAAEEPLSPEVPVLAGDVERESLRQPTDVPELLRAIERLLTFLASAAGYTQSNVWQSARFLATVGPLDHLPEDIFSILSDMAGPMREAVRNPGYAQQVGATPDLLLARTRAQLGQ